MDSYNQDRKIADLMADPRSAKKKLENAQRDAAKIIAATFSGPEGKRALNILSTLFYTKPCFDEADPNPFLAAKRDGSRHVIQTIYDLIARAQNE